MVYIVSVDYTKFEFMNGNTALTFAELAKGSVVSDAEVEIELKTIDILSEVKDDVGEALEEVED